MRRIKHLLWLSALPLLSVQSLFASTVQVGTCMPPLQSFTTISAAVSSVPSGSTVDVCPGTYAEQVTITVPLTLQGVAAGTANQVVVTVPTAGLGQTRPACLGSRWRLRSWCKERARSTSATLPSMAQAAICNAYRTFGSWEFSTVPVPLEPSMKC